MKSAPYQQPLRVLESKNISIACDKVGLQGRNFYNRLTSLRINN